MIIFFIICAGKVIYQNQNNPDYYYEDPRPKIDQPNVIAQIASLKTNTDYHL